MFGSIEMREGRSKAATVEFTMAALMLTAAVSVPTGREAFPAAAFLAGLSSTATDADLQSTCASAYDSCLRPDGGAGGGFTCTGAPPANCTTTVAELGACLSDQATATHVAASAVPACSALSRARKPVFGLHRPLV